VVVLAGYRPTPAEEMPDDARDQDGKPEAKKKDEKPAFISQAQKSELAEVAKQAGWTGAALQAFVKENYGGWPKMPAADFDTVKQKLSDGIDTGAPKSESDTPAPEPTSAPPPAPAPSDVKAGEIPF
jgi:hypothetical protein